MVGDYIIEDTNGKEGTVKEIQIFYTKLSTIDNKTIVIPNGMLTNNSITNATAKDERQLDLRVGISYNADIKKAKSMIEKLLSEDASILKEEQMNVFVNDLADSAVVLGIRAWVKNEEYWATRWRLLEEIKVELDENGIEIPYPQVTVHRKRINSWMKICKARQICRDVHGRENPKRSWQNFWFAYENLLKSFSEKNV